MKTTTNLLIKAQRQDKARAIEILTRSFEKDPHVSWLAGEGKGRESRLRTLMEFSFEKAMANGSIYFTPGKNGLALWMDKTQNNMTPQLLWLYLKFVMVMGIKRVSSITKLEEKIEARYPKGESFMYLWLLGVDPKHQGKGLSSQLFLPMLAKAERDQTAVYLETSTARNIAIYERKGFRVYDQMLLDEGRGTEIFFMRRD